MSERIPSRLAGATSMPSLAAAKPEPLHEGGEVMSDSERMKKYGFVYKPVSIPTITKSGESRASRTKEPEDKAPASPIKNEEIVANRPIMATPVKLQEKGGSNPHRNSPVNAVIAMQREPLTMPVDTTNDMPAASNSEFRPVSEVRMLGIITQQQIQINELAACLQNCVTPDTFSQVATKTEVKPTAEKMKRPEILKQHCVYTHTLNAGVEAYQKAEAAYPTWKMNPKKRPEFWGKICGKCYGDFGNRGRGCVVNALAMKILWLKFKLEFPETKLQPPKDDEEEEEGI